MIVYRLLASAAEQFPDRLALSFGARTWTFREVADAADRLAALLASRGTRPGDLVGLFMPNRPEWLFWFGAVSRVGGILVPINPAYTVAEVRSILSLARPRLLVIDEALAKAWDARALREDVGDVLLAGVLPEHEARPADPAAAPETAATVIYF